MYGRLDISFDMHLLVFINNNNNSVPIVERLCMSWYTKESSDISDGAGKPMMLHEEEMISSE